MGTQSNLEEDYQYHFLQNIIKKHSIVIVLVFLGTLIVFITESAVQYLLQLIVYSIILIASWISYSYLQQKKYDHAKNIYLSACALFPLIIMFTAGEFLLVINVAVIAYFVFVATLLFQPRQIYFWGGVYILCHYIGLFIRYFYPLEGFELQETSLARIVFLPLIPLLIFVALSHVITRIIQDLVIEKSKIALENEVLYQQSQQELDDRIQTAEKLRLLSKAIEQSHTSVVITDKQGHITYVNPAFTQATGYTQEEAIGQHTRLLKSGITPPEQFEAMWQAILQGKTWQGEFANRKKSGEIFWELASVSPIINDNGETTNFIALKEDITTRKEAEQALAFNEKYLHTILEHSPVGILIVQDDGSIIFSNNTVETLFGYTHEEFSELSVEDLVPAHQQQIHRAQREEYFANPHARDEQYIMAQGLELHGKKKDGNIMPVQIILQNMEFEEKSSTIAFVHDISKQQQFEEQRLQFLLEKERINILAHFIRNAAHEFRTPLSIIQTNAYLMQHIKDFEQNEKYRQSIEIQIDTMTRLLDNLITMTRLDNIQVYPTEKYSINSLIKDLLISTETWLQSKKLIITADLSQNLPNTSINTNDLVLALQQILTNAIQYSPPEGTINIGTFTTERYIGIKIQDYGNGIPAELLDRIFDRFYRIDETHDERGFGLGLSIAKKISELHQGKIEVESEVGTGTTVTLLLPISLTNKPNSL